MRKQWKPGPFLLPFSGLGTRLKQNTPIVVDGPSALRSPEAIQLLESHTYMPCDVTRDPQHSAARALALHACIERSIEACPGPNAPLVLKPTLALIRLMYPKY